MPSNSETILTQNVHPGDSTTETITGEKYKGDGYYGRSDGFHSVQFNLIGFIGTISMQGTLAIDPASTDWFDIDGTTHTSIAVDTQLSDGGHIYNFTGNYVWVRVTVTNWTDGTVDSVYLNH
jgi:hypothetical protein